MNFAFDRQLRLLCPKDFKHVFDQVDIKAGTGELLVLVRDDQIQKTAKLGLVVAKKNLKRAVDRNQFKRVIRESFRHHQHALKGLNIIVLTRQSAKNCDKETLRKAIDQAWQRILKKRTAVK